MDKQDISLSKQEIEKLCSLYMECGLTLLEEVELEYVLGKVPYHSPVIDETRTLMDIGRLSSISSETEEKATDLRNMRTRWTTVLSVAASVSIILVASICLLRHTRVENCSLCEVYIHGKVIDGKEAEAYADYEIERIDRFLEQIRNAEEEEEAKISVMISSNNKDLK